MKRGVMAGPDLSISDLDTLKTWNVNLIRWQFVRGTDENSDNIAEYQAWLQGMIDQFKTFASDLDSRGIQVVVDLHTPPGGFQYDANGNATHKIFENEALRNEFLNAWKTISEQLKPYYSSTIYGYDLLNEPAVGLVNNRVTKERTDLWRELAEQTITLVRNIDGQAQIIIEPAYGTAENLKRLDPITSFKNLLYSFHHYYPLGYTHQGLYGRPAPKPLPELSKIQSDLNQALKYQNKHDVKLYVGEFSAVGTAPEAATYLKDSIEFFEANNWNWTYHAFREASVWNVEIGTPERKETLLSFFAKNT